MKYTKRRSKGFSLLELMVVVAVIGILATIGIPQYQKFMAKSRQAEAKTYLNSIFVGQTAFFTEFNQYSTNLRILAVSNKGRMLRYNAGFDTITNTNYTALAPPGTHANNDIVAIAASDASTEAYWAFSTLNEPSPSITSCDSTPGSQSFVAAAWGNPTNSFGTTPNNAGNNADRFTIDQTKLIIHTSVGM